MYVINDSNTKKGIWHLYLSFKFELHFEYDVGLIQWYNNGFHIVQYYINSINMMLFMIKISL